MKARTLWLNVMLLLALLMPGVGRPLAAALPEEDITALSAAPVTANVDVNATLRNSPVMFIKNVGQFADGARFQVRGGNGTIWLAEDALWITLMEPPAPESRTRGRRLEFPFDPEAPSASENRQGINLRLSFPNANPHARLEPFAPLETTVSYFLGNDPDGWRPDVPVWSGVRYVDLYPGIDLEVTSENGQWVQRVHIHPGADLGQVQLHIEGAEAAEFTGAGEVRLSTVIGDYILPLPVVADAMPKIWPAISAVDVAKFDITCPIVASSTQITPAFAPQGQSNPSQLPYSTFLGGSSWDVGVDIAVDESGAAYVTGYTNSSNFPTTSGAFDIVANGYYDGFVVKVTPDGNALAYATYLGGNTLDEG